MYKSVTSIYSYQQIDGLIPGVRGQRAFPTLEFKTSDPFLMLDHIGPDHMGDQWFLDGTGHDHPHRGFETLTFMFEGKMHHRDSLGNRLTLSSGSVQRMNAGSGIIHGGDMAVDAQTGTFHELQLWVNNPTSEKMSAPEVHNLSAEEIPVTVNGNHTLRIISGELNGLSSDLQTKAQTQIGHLIAKGPGRIDIGSFPTENKVMLYVLKGEAQIGKTTLPEFHLGLLSSEGDSVEIQTEGPAQLLILSGKPLNQPTAFGGPFVMNTEAEIQKAFEDYQQGKFGSIY